MHNMSGPQVLKLSRRRPVLFVTPALIRPTAFPHYERERDGYRVRFTNYASENLRFSMEKPSLVPFDMRRIRPRGAWADHFFTVMRDAGQFRMWYEVIRVGSKSDIESHVRYAESQDGVEWTTPRLKLPRSTTRGARNRVYPVAGHRSHGVTVFKDPSDARYPYKLAGYGKSDQGEDQIEGARSTDGLRWEALERPLVPRYFSDTQSVASYDPATRKYMGFFRYTYYDRRGIGYAQTDDFETWPRPEPLLLSDSLQEDIYTNGYTVYPHNPAMRFLFPAIYKKNPDTFELVAYASLEGRVWMPVGDESFLTPERIEGEPNSLVCAGVGLTPMPDGRIGLPVGYTACTHNAVKSIHRGLPHACYTWAVWDRDRLGGVSCQGEGGFTTIRLNAPPGAVSLNFKTGLSGEVRVQVRGETWGVVPGYAFEDCCLLNGDHTAKKLVWSGKRRLPSLPKMTLQFYLRNAKLYGLTVG